MDASIADPNTCRVWGRRSTTLARRLVNWVASLVLGLGFATSAMAASTAAADAGKNPDKLYVDADQLVYDKDRNIVTANGGVVLYYKHRVLQADHVVYDRGAKRVSADGRAKFTDERGNVTYSPKFDFTDDFASGFADGVQELATNKTRFSSPRIERSAGSLTVLTQGAYTACEPCKEHPELPALWQVRAAKIIENQTTHTVYFENAWLDVYGVPVAYVPYMSAPDPTVTRASGVLAPSYSTKSTLGAGVTVPYFLALAPNYDLTLSPSYFSQQGPFADVEWRHRLENGDYSIRLTGIDQLKPRNFLAAPYGAASMTWRGSLESQGKILLNDKWKFGWDLTLLSDRFYLNDYRLQVLDPSQNYFQDIVSSVYLRGQSERSFFDLSGYHFLTTTAYLDQRQDANAAPTLDYNRTFPVDPDRSGGLGGELNFDFNAKNLNRSEALYQSVGLQRFDNAFGLYSTCATYTPGTRSNNCLLRGMAGNDASASAQLSWQRKIVDPLGEIWTPFAFARVAGSSTTLNTSGNYVYSSTYGVTAISNSTQPAFFNGASAGSSATAMPGVGLDYRFPFVSNSSFGQQIVEPIAQIIARPNEILPTIRPNEDAQSLVFDETNLFAWDKYSGYDRVEGGTRVNYGAQYTANFANGGHMNVVGGQSIQVAGQNSYTIADAANTGLESGLDKRYSNLVIGETLQPFRSDFTLSSKQQFDPRTGALARFDGIMAAKVGGLTASLDYGHYAAQPALGWLYQREGLLAKATYKVTDNFTVDGSIILDMSRHYYDTPSEQSSRFYPTNYHLGVAYQANDCTTFKISYTSSITDPIVTAAGVPAPPGTRDQTVLFELDLRTLGDIKGSTGVSN